MALYAVDDDDLIFAAQAESGKAYFCLECFMLVKVRRGKNRIPHFYHAQPAPKCRLYSKSEDHLLAQIELQRQFPPGALQMERPFSDIFRVADLCWGKEKIVFEIQCSLLQPAEVESRIHDYRSSGYEIIWLLDDRVFNRRALRNSEILMRTHWCYYLQIKRGKELRFYDQFEILSESRRMKKGKPLWIELQKVCSIGSLPKDPPQQIAIRAKNTSRYVWGDRIHLAMQSRIYPSFSLLLENWRTLEILLPKKKRKAAAWKLWLIKYILNPYKRMLLRLNA